jgi:hypothetical protein
MLHKFKRCASRDARQTMKNDDQKDLAFPDLPEPLRTESLFDPWLYYYVDCRFYYNSEGKPVTETVWRLKQP